jgi:hypothetical protein
MKRSYQGIFFRINADTTETNFTFTILTYS